MLQLDSCLEIAKSAALLAGKYLKDQQNKDLEILLNEGRDIKLQIDVEGAEYKIMNSIDYNKIKIKNIFFESKHFDGTFTEGEKLKKIKDKLILNGYNLKQIDKENILATK